MSNLTKSVVLNYHRIRWISIVGGFMDGIWIEFAPGLNCSIGERGTGKTTVLEFIRFALDPMADDREACKGIEALGNSSVDCGRHNLIARGAGGYPYTGWMDVKIVGQSEPLKAAPAPAAKRADAASGLGRDGWPFGSGHR